jgi:hypothetical protein
MFLYFECSKSTWFGNRFAISGGACTPAASSAAAFRSLGQNLSKQRVVLIFVHMMDTDMPVIKHISQEIDAYDRANTPLEIVRTRISVFSEGTEGAHITRAVVDQSVADHLVLAFESLASFASRTAFDRAIVWTAWAVHVCVRAIELVRRMRRVRNSDGMLTWGDTESGKAEHRNQGDRKGNPQLLMSSFANEALKILVYHPRRKK